MSAGLSMPEESVATPVTQHIMSAPGDMSLAIIAARYDDKLVAPTTTHAGLSMTEHTVAKPASQTTTAL